MEGRIQRIFVAGVLVAMAGIPTFAAKPDDLELEPMVVREPERREINVDKIDRENFEIGPYGGIMSVEDFGTNLVYGLRLDYHVTEDFFVETVYGKTELGLTSFERLSGGAPLLTPDQREMTYYNLSVGWNVFPGEAFVTRKWAFKGGLYLIAGAGATEFGGDQRFTVNAGVGYRLIATDWLAFRLDLRDHVFTSDLLGANATKHNFEFSGGMTLFF
ncbi:MAG: outer membrane beta-barrel domain-containing protein [Gammaproteobacteria bacterium]|nr:outer membrane beta-barrel domain-containing protein [Gammaproteobacteria bacterium]